MLPPPSPRSTQRRLDARPPRWFMLAGLAAVALIAALAVAC